MAARAGYTALPTPDSTHFNVPNASGFGSTESGYAHLESVERVDTRSSGDTPGQNLRNIWSRAQTIARNNNGLLLVTASQAFLSLMNFAVKILNGIDPPVSTFELIVVRMGITYVCSILYMYWAGIPDPILGPKGVRSLLIFRGASGFFGLFGIYYSLVYLSLSDATVLTFLAPLCTTIAGSFFLGEKFTYREILAGCVSLIGVVLIARPAAVFGQSTSGNTGTGTPHERIVPVGVALVGVLGGTGAYITIRAIGTRAHALHSVSFFSMLCVVVGSAGMIINKTPIVVPQRLEWLGMLAMIGIFGFIAQFLLAMGLQRETAGRGTMAIYTQASAPHRAQFSVFWGIKQVIFAVVLEIVFFHTLPSLLSVIGTLFIMGSALYVVLIKENDSPNTSKPANRHSEDLVLEEGLLQGRSGPDDVDADHNDRDTHRRHN